MFDSGSKRFLADTLVSIDQSMTETLVLLAVQLKDTELTPKLLSWQNWCHNLAPDDIESVHALGRLKMRDLIKLEGQFLSNSSLLLVSLPIFIWDRLPKNPAYSFVSFVKSANLVTPSLNSQLEIYSNSSTNKEDWAKLKAIKEQSEFYWNHQGGNERNRQLRYKMALAIDYEKQGLWGESEKLFKEVVSAQQSVLGDEHPDTLISMGNLASTYRNQGRWTEAGGLEVQVMETFTRVLGEDHPSTLTSMANLASTYGGQGRLKEAEELFVRVMETRKRVLGEEHPSMLTTMNNLALVLDNQGKHGEAEAMHRQNMATSERVLGPEHPSTLTSMSNLAQVLGSQGKYEEAEAMHRRTLATSERVLGPEHPSTLTTVYYLAHLLASRHRYDESTVLFERACAGYNAALGKGS